MKLKQFTHSGVTVKYAYLGSKQGSKKALIVSICNPFERDGTVEFLRSLAPFDVPRLFIAAAKEYQFGLYLLKDGTTAPRDAILNLIEKYRIENGIEKSDTYLVAFCLATKPAMVMAVENGYNLIITEFVYGSSISGLWRDDDPEKLQFRSALEKVRGPYMEFTFGDFRERLRAFTGNQRSPDSPGYVSSYLDEVSKTQPHKFSVPKVYFLGGKSEESWRLSGEKTIGKLREFGLDVEVTVSDAEYTHTEALPHFISYFTGKLREIGL